MFWLMLSPLVGCSRPVCCRSGGAVVIHKVQHEPFLHFGNLLPLLGQEFAVLGLARQVERLHG